MRYKMHIVNNNKIHGDRLYKQYLTYSKRTSE